MVALAGALFAQNREREQVRPRGSVPVFLLGKLRYGTRALGGDSAVRWARLRWRLTDAV